MGKLYTKKLITYGKFASRLITIYHNSLGMTFCMDNV